MKLLQTYTDEKISKMIFKRRQALCFTMRQAAEYCTMSQTCYRDYESGEKSLYSARPYTIARVCRFLQIKPDELFEKS